MGAAGRIADRALAGGFEVLRRRAGNRAKAWLRARFPGLQNRVQAGTRGIASDWAGTRAWTEGGHIFVNTRGTWPEGRVEAGAEREELLEELREGLLALRDAATGESAVAEVTRGDEEFEGPEADLMPDLLVHWRSDLRVRALIAADGGVIRRPDAPEVPFGAHHPDGTLIASGSRFRRSAEPVRHSIYDVAPTLLHLLGRPVPEYFDGRVMVDLLTTEAAKDVRRVAGNAPRGGEERTEAAGDDGVVADRLRSLGYIE